MPAMTRARITQTYQAVSSHAVKARMNESNGVSEATRPTVASRAAQHYPPLGGRQGRALPQGDTRDPAHMRNGPRSPKRIAGRPVIREAGAG